MMREYPFNAIGGVLTALLLCVGPVRLTAADPETSTPGGDQAVTLIKTPHEILTRQKLPNFVGISAQTARARGLSMNLVVIPPGAAAEPLFHKGLTPRIGLQTGRNKSPSPLRTSMLTSPSGWWWTRSG